MPYDDHDPSHMRPSLAAAVADLMAVDALRDDEAALRAALRAAITGTRDPVGVLWDEYRGGRPAGLHGPADRHSIRPRRAA
jgi:hypothetical protein